MDTEPVNIKCTLYRISPDTLQVFVWGKLNAPLEEIVKLCGRSGLCWAHDFALDTKPLPHIVPTQQVSFKDNM